MSIECVIFDCDGLMFDTEKVANENWREIAGQYGITLDDEFFYQIIGCGHKLFLKAMENHQDLEPHLPEISEGRLKKIFGMCENKGSLNKKGLTELLDYLEEAGIKKCVASSSHREYVDTLLGSIGKPYHFDRRGNKRKAGSGNLFNRRAESGRRSGELCCAGRFQVRHHRCEAGRHEKRLDL